MKYSFIESVLFFFILLTSLINHKTIMSNSQDKVFSRCIIINSTVYFVMAYFFVVFSYNLFSIWMSTTLFGFDAELYFHGFAMKGATWTKDNMVIIFFFGNSIALLYGFIFDWLYRRQRKYKRGIKLFFMWSYIIAYSWFMGNFIVGAIFNFGIGTALRAFRIPFFLRLIFAFVSIVFLLYIGYRAQKGIKVSANLYFKRLGKSAIVGFLLNQIVYPAIIGTIILVLYKIPNIDEYHYMDWLVLSAVVLYIIGLLLKHKHSGTITFKNRNLKNNDEEKDTYSKNKNCKIQWIAVIVFIIVIAAMRIGLDEPLLF